jgi:hypothetical protein
MDTFRGRFGSKDERSHDWHETPDPDEGPAETPPSPVGQDERRMQVRAYNYWASLLGERNFPSINALEPERMGDFGPYSVLLDFKAGVENPVVAFLGEALARECGTDHDIRRLDDVPSLSLLSRITDHYMQILANEAPIGFEAEFVNQRGLAVLYRGILLPFSSDNETIDHLYGIINWKELAEQQAADELLLEIDQAFENDARAEEIADDGVLDLSLVGMVADGPYGDTSSDDERAVSEGTSGDAQGRAEPDDLSGDAGEPAAAEDDVDAERTGPNADALVDTGGDMYRADADGEPADIDPVDEDEPIFLQPDFGDDENLTHDDYEEGEEGGDDHLPSLIDIQVEKTAAKSPLYLEELTALDSWADDGGDVDKDETRFDGAGAEPEEAEANEPEDAEATEELRHAEDEEATAGEDHAFDEEETRALATGSAGRSAMAGASISDITDAVRAAAARRPARVPLDLVASQDGVGLDEKAGAGFGEDEDDDAPITRLPLPQAEALARIAAAMGVARAEGHELRSSLAAARESAANAARTEERSRAALYEALGHAYDLSLRAKGAAEEFAALLEENGLTAQQRAPMTPVVKLVFGADYDRTRLAEYAAVLAQAHRLELEAGTLAGRLADTEGGLKAMVAAERQARRAERDGGGAGETAGGDIPRPIAKALAARLRALPATSIGELAAEEEFGIVLVRRSPEGGVELVGEAQYDRALVERIGRRVAG